MRRAVALVLLPALGLGACGGSGHSAAPPASTPASAIPEVSDIAGEVVVTDLDAIRYVGASSGCVSLAPYGQVGRGTRVVVRSDTGSIKAVTHLYGGTLRREGTAQRPAGCVFGFDYAGAAAGRPTYTVRVGRQPLVRVPFAGLTRIVVRVPAT